MKGKKGSMPDSTRAILWLITILGIIGVIGVAVLYGVGFFGAVEPDKIPDKEQPGAPSTMLSAITIETKDALATTDTDINASYWIFNGDGTVFKSGTVDATETVNVNYDPAATYDILTYEDGGTGDDYYHVWKTVVPDAAAKTVTCHLRKEGQPEITKMNDPIDNDANISTGAGITASFEAMYKNNISESAIYKPILLAEVNATSVVDVSITGATRMTTTPTRVTTTSGYKLLAFQLPEEYLEASDGIVIRPGTIKFSSSTAPSTDDYATFKIVDQAMWRKAIFTNKIDFLIGAENTETFANIGGIDSATSALQFD